MSDFFLPILLLTALVCLIVGITFAVVETNEKRKLCADKGGVLLSTRNGGSVCIRADSVIPIWPE